MLFWHGIPWGVDFRGGTLVYVKFSHPPNDNAVRSALDRVGLHNFRLQTLGDKGSNELLIDLSVQETSEEELNGARTGLSTLWRPMLQRAKLTSTTPAL